MTSIASILPLFSRKVRVNPPTWTTFRDAQIDDEECKEWSKEAICDRKARRKPRSVRRDYAQRLPTSGLLAGEGEPFLMYF
jgi:hypothetical protein